MEDIIELVIHIMKGLIVGVVCSAPMGPVGILCLRRTIKKGRPYGIATGAGAALSDLFYALLTGYGLSLISGYTTHDNIFGIKIAGGIMLMVFGIYMYRTGPRVNYHPEGKTKGSLLRNFITSFFITLCNPVIIFLFLALFNMLAPFAAPDKMYLVLAGYGSIAVGAMLWWVGLTYVVHKMSSNFGEKGIRRLNKTIGIFVMVISFAYLLLTLCGISIIGGEEIPQ
ncbi:MAG: LysE family translocator [Bacteroidales bacterium]|nr:LysE family translocator [Bacteroidales bacterium]MCI6251762.1 LysE family translocator [Bacteroidales bacterium]MDY4030849.1 LysE family transporter [Alloprevotella sp.]MDY5087924.1 LysE family transporter [Alloprevotella sp.]